MPASFNAQIAELQSQYENVEQEDERSGTLDMNLIAQKLDEWQKVSTIENIDNEAMRQGRDLEEYAVFSSVLLSQVIAILCCMAERIVYGRI